MEDLFLLALAMATLSGAFTLGFISQAIFIRIFKGKDAFKQFIKEEF